MNQTIQTDTPFFQFTLRNLLAFNIHSLMVQCTIFKAKLFENPFWPT